ncbi:bifunctional ADP-dependent NAD(P)H-hydrate dehydratase/NAD(P)H-hydrate epimerase [Massilia sp. CF038]|uniref:bifunctional ADP-dependent NAD(P)H-hydrate dehydratase/NAD(P)H-hydrate epimerase n=1 Tax=Massilia sp. CF038 TaxID=1881045 RepID=UPI000923FB21|nr:bifunctional ADP-dependent NAD(P)H-hydrate dehydratase/NAD(P)H-hydrate epimerase [Massilia sp. CF038]SHG77883.1 yjeF C-terminal region, hydroxyethylthiazole kinase-related/yjeF N-terminal region [Massilia sp. CF038]
MTPLYSVAEIRGIEQAAAASLPAGSLMQRAGLAAAAAALDMAGNGSVLLLAGPGNNGGDALETAANLSQAGVEVAVLHLPGEGTISAETAHALARARASAARFVDALPAHGEWALVVDGLFGIGLARPLAGAARALALAINDWDCPVLALDVPSGLDADSGAVIGPDGVAIEATRTITFIGDKPGLHTFAGRDVAGDILVASLGIDTALVPASSAHLGSAQPFASRLTARRHNSHKGSFGDVAILGGAAGMAGAPVLAARSALFAGAGRVFVAAIDPGAAFDSAHPEIMFRAAAGFAGTDSTLVAGPGMGDSAAAIRVLVKALDSMAPLVLDADALNLVAASLDLQGHLAQRQAATVLTPHPLEAARLLGVTTAVIQGDRLAAAREMAARFQAVVVLKGSGSVIADPDGAAVINPTGNPGLATGGTGDVLAGLCGALLAQGWTAWEAALGAVWMHGAAADLLVAQGVGPVGLTAGELAPAIRTVFNQLIRQYARQRS